MELDNTAIVPLGSCSDIPKALSVLKAMDIKACAIADLDFAFTEARKGTTPFLPKDDKDITRVKEILLRLQTVNDFTLANNGLPQSKGRWKAADVWALVAKEPEGEAIMRTVHDRLRPYNIWVWTQGCIEHVTCTAGKGEEEILKQEDDLRVMNAEEVEREIPAFKACFEWIRSL